MNRKRRFDNINISDSPWLCVYEKYHIFRSEYKYLLNDKFRLVPDSANGIIIPKAYERLWICYSCPIRR